MLDLFAFEVEVGEARKSGGAPIDTIVSALDAFPRAIAAFSKPGRTQGKARIRHEPELQRWLHVALTFLSDDVRAEEPTPSHVGASARMDFYLPNERLAVEAKMTRKTLTDAKIGDALLVDIQRYQRRADCDALLCFIYDPHQRIRNPDALKRDVEMDSGRLTVRVLIPR